MSDRRAELPPFDPVSMLRWSWRMAEEFRQLPDVIAQWREGVTLFLAVARRLEAATSSAEAVLAQVEAAGLVEQLQRLQTLSYEIGRATAAGSSAMGEQWLEETRRNLEAFTRLFVPPSDAAE